MLRIILLVLLVWQIWTALGKAEEEIVSSLSIEFQEKELVLRAQGIPLGNILDRIRHDCSVEIIGLEAKQNESITFSCKGESLKVLLKRLIWHLGEKNYAFEFVGERLIRAYVVPEAKGDVCAVPGQMNEKAIQNQPGHVVKIESIAEGSQAEAMNLQKGDYIIQYDGHRISWAVELWKKVTKNLDVDQVEMIILRNGKPMQFFFNRGLVGVRVKTVEIPNELIDSIGLGNF